MITADNIELTKHIAKHFHKGQKYGEHDYYEYHLLGVANLIKSVIRQEVTEDMIIVALLHDVLEDTCCAYETMNNIFGDSVVKAVSILTKSPYLSKADYIERIIRHENARIVKYADSLFNYNECIKQLDFKRAGKYKSNLDILYHPKLFNKSNIVSYDKYANMGEGRIV